ncbi:MAG: molybdopterin-dependent oxidoreductase [Deltaproteobacteria bacterium]|nr:molybdopterin-dependent oxidoreductase [Deltaproteobacteria bacterium]
MPTLTRTCNVCEAMCGLLVTTENGRITDIRGDKDNVLSRGHLCPKGPAMREVLEDPARLKRPMRRTGSTWTELGWDEALDEAAARLRRVQEQHGKDSVGVYMGNPNVHNHGASFFLTPFLRALRTKSRYDANSQDANPKLFACLMMFNNRTSITVPDVDRTDFFLALGANPAASNGSLMSLGDVRGRLTGIVKRGGRFVLIDPRRTESAAWASEHHAIRPGGDPAFLLSMLHVIFAGQNMNEYSLRNDTEGLDALKSLAARFPPERVSAAVGLDADVIRGLARDFAAARRAVAYSRVGTCVNEFGPLGAWLTEALNVVTGNFDREGGMMFPSPAVDLSGALGEGRLPWGRWRSRTRGLPEFGGNLPGATMAEDMENEGEGRLRGFVTVAGNPVLSVPNGPRLARALDTLDTYVAVDFYLSETTRHAHLILPPTHALEHTHFDLVFHTLAVRNTVAFSEQVVAPEENTRHDWQILAGLTERIGGADQLPRAEDGSVLPPDALLAQLLPMGSSGLTLDQVRAQPHGIDLGPLVPQREKRVRGKLQLAPQCFLDDARRLDDWIDRARQGELLLIGRRHLRTNNSWMHNCHSLTKGKDRATLLVHPDDAQRLQLSEGKLARISSRAGTVEAPVELSSDVRPGVVSLPHGYGHAELHAGPFAQPNAAQLPGPNINALTDDQHVEPLLGTAILNGVPVEVRPL